MAKIIEEVAVRIGADTRKLEKGMKRADSGVKKLVGSFKKLAAVIGISLGARAVFRTFARTLDTSNKLIKTAKGVGFLASEYRELTFAMNQVGVRSHSAIIALGDFQKRLGKAVAGTSPQFAKAFRDAGLDPGALSKLDPAEAFDVALNRLASLKGDPRLAGLTGAVFEEQSGKDVLKIIRQWEAFTAARVKHARRVSTLDADQQFRIEFLAEEVGVYKAQWAALKETVVADATPAIVKMLEEIEKSGAMDLLAKDLTALALAFVDITDRLIKFRVAWANGSDAFSLTPAFGVTALRTPKGALSPQERAEDEAAKLRIMRAPGLARSHVQRESAAGMSLEITVKGDTANSRDLARRIAVEVQKLKASEMRAAQ
jgi:hypothetical protein